MRWCCIPIVIAVVLGASGAASCSTGGTGRSGRAPVTPVQPPALGDAAPRDYAGLHNVVAYHDGYYSGSVPEGDAGFTTLAGMGVKTIISVDGAAPDVAGARARGMRYIHLPIGYNGFDETRKRELARATRDAMTEGPVYIHCHHGKHRSAGAAGAAAVALGWATPDEMVARMKVSGTAPSYRGLYACTASAVALSAADLNSVGPRFPEVSPPQGFVRAMVEVEEISDHMKAIEKAGWRTPDDHPDLVPVAEAGRMADLFRLMGEDTRVVSGPPEFADGLRQNGDLAQQLEDMLATGNAEGAALSAQWRLVLASCKDCHVKFRD